jgi:hypothetical protein
VELDGRRRHRRGRHRPGLVRHHKVGLARQRAFSLCPFSAQANDAQCCSAEINGGGGWGVFNALFGWTNSATYGSVLSYNLYWLAIMAGFAALRYKETRGHWPLLKPGKEEASVVDSLSDEPVDIEKSAVVETTSEVLVTEVGK